MVGFGAGCWLFVYAAIMISRNAAETLLGVFFSPHICEAFFMPFWTHVFICSPGHIHRCASVSSGAPQLGQTSYSAQCFAVLCPTIIDVLPLSLPLSLLVLCCSTLLLKTSNSMTNVSVGEQANADDTVLLRG